MEFHTPDITAGDNTLATWRHTNEARDAARYLDRRRGPDRDMIGDVRRRRTRAPEGMFPFKVYLAQLGFDNASFTTLYSDTTTWWRILTVRCGRVADQSLYGPGSDGYDEDPYSDYFAAVDDNSDAVSPITVPDSTDAYYIWIECLAVTQTEQNPSGLQPQLHWDVDPTSDDSDDGVTIVRPWENYPAWDGIHWQVAKVNTNITIPAPTEENPDATAKVYQAQIRQIASRDITEFPREVKDCVTIEGTPTVVYRQALVSDHYTTAIGNR